MNECVRQNVVNTTALKRSGKEDTKNWGKEETGLNE